MALVQLLLFAVGLFACCIFAFLAAVYLIGEAKGEHIRAILIKQAVRANIATIIAGGLVFVAAYLDGFALIDLLINHPFGAVCLALATLSIPVLWYCLNLGQVLMPRLLAGFQVCLILVAWLWIQFPVVVKIADAEHLTLQNSRAPEATIYVLGWALVVGSGLILPALFYLLKSFKGNVPLQAEPHH